MAEGSREGRDVKILLSKAQIYNTSLDYENLITNLNDWKQQMGEQNLAMLNSNDGKYSDATYKSLSKYLDGEMSDLISEAELTHTTLVEATTQAKTLLARCADFPNVLKNGPSDGVGDYSSASEGSLNLLYFDDVYCKEDLDYLGLIHNSTALVSESYKKKMGDNLKDLVDTLDAMESTHPSIDSYKETLDKSIENYDHVAELYDSLVAYGKGVKALNDYVCDQFKNYDEIEVSQLNHYRSYTYDGLRTDDVEYIAQARLLKEGLTVEEINALSSDGYVTKNEIAAAYVGGSKEDKEMLEHLANGEYSEAFNTSPDYISDATLIVVRGMHASKLNSSAIDPENQDFIDFNNAFIVDEGGFVHRMAELPNNARPGEERYTKIQLVKNLYAYEDGFIPNDYFGEDYGDHEYKLTAISYDGNGLISGLFSDTNNNTYSSEEKYTIDSAFIIGTNGKILDQSVSAEDYNGMTDEEKLKFITGVYAELLKQIPPDGNGSGNMTLFLGFGIEIDFEYKVITNVEGGDVTVKIAGLEEGMLGALDSFELNTGAGTLVFGQDGAISLKDNTTGALVGLDSEVVYVGAESTITANGATYTVGATYGYNAEYNRTQVYVNGTTGAAEVDTQLNVRVDNAAPGMSAEDLALITGVTCATVVVVVAGVSFVCASAVAAEEIIKWAIAAGEAYQVYQQVAPGY